MPQFFLQKFLTISTSRMAKIKRRHQKLNHLGKKNNSIEGSDNIIIITNMNRKKVILAKFKKYFKKIGLLMLEIRKQYHFVVMIL